MRLDDDECWARLVAAGHGVLATLHDERGVDAVPVVFVVIDGVLVIPVDTVKAKEHTRLQRLANLAGDPRCVLLVERYDDDWSQLWWVRVHGRGRQEAPSAGAIEALARRFPAYAAPGSVVATVILEPTGVRGWAA